MKRLWLIIVYLLFTSHGTIEDHKTISKKSFKGEFPTWIVGSTGLCTTNDLTISIGFLDVTLSPGGKWRRRFLALYSGELLIFPRRTSQAATARVKLPGHRIEACPRTETGFDFTFKLVKKNKATLYMKVGFPKNLTIWHEPQGM